MSRPSPNPPAVLRLLTCTVLLALCALPFACGSSSEEDCVDLCEQSKACSSLPGISTTNCADGCAQLEDIIDSADCHDDYQQFLSCAIDAADVCDAQTSCASEGAGYAFCVSTYCNAHPADCVGLYCTYGSSGTAPSCSADATCRGPHYSMSCDGTQCICTTDGSQTSTVAYDASLCIDDLDARVAAAAAACHWSL